MIDFASVQTENYLDSLGSDVVHFKVSQHAQNGREVRGFGSSFKPRSAMLKATSEFFERATMIFHSRTTDIKCSNGFAAHISPEFARNAAIAELLERDVVISAWLARRPPQWLNLETIQLSNEASLALRKLANSNLECRIGIQGQIGEYFIVVSILQPKSSERQFGFTYASCASSTLSEAIDGVILNQRRNLTYIDANRNKIELPFQELDVREPGHHRDYYLNPTRTAGTEWLLSSHSPFREYEVPVVTIKDWQLPVAPPWPLSVAQAFSESLQPYFVGPSEINKIRVQRAKKFLIGSSDQFNFQVHPLP